MPSNPRQINSPASEAPSVGTDTPDRASVRATGIIADAKKNGVALPLFVDQMPVMGKQKKTADRLLSQLRSFGKVIRGMPVDEATAFLNEARQILHDASPFKDEPVDCVLWVNSESVCANDYNPNAVAPPEMALLEHSISEDGYTQPIVSWNNVDEYEVVDGFHRHRVGKESKAIRERIHGYLPVVVINSKREDKGDRMAATIRHNRARGKHKVDAMSDIVIELKRRRWSDEKIGKELGMDPDEVLRLTQVSGLAEMFKDREFSQAWEAEKLEEELGE